ncbi:hypothetical protein [uncultured Kordia sp.]|uniref:hypothetical protein n=1 Tax=uncultured Kordia sp. TaxID=507699 RepID=UPI002617DAA5|nr:hypothetical protein [uncultured Kordia sp.]
MKKKNLKSLSLKKASVSKLNGGAQAPIPIPLTIDIRECYFTWDIRQCTWYSELYTACDCEPSWDLGCQVSFDAPCEP